MVGVGLPSDDADLAAAARCRAGAHPGPDGDPEAPLQALVTNLDASDYLGRLAIGRVVQGTLRSGEPVALLTEEYEEGQAPIVRRPARSWRSRASHGRTPRCCEPATSSSSPATRRWRSATPSPPRGPEAAAPADRGRARPGHDVQRQHVAAVGSVGQVRHQPPSPGAARTRGAGQRLHPPGGHGQPGRARGGRPRRAAARRAHRVHATRGLRAPGEPAGGHHPGDRRQAPRAAGAGHLRRARRARRHRHPGAGPPQGRRDRAPAGRSGPDDHHVRGPGARPDRLPLAPA